MKGNDKEPVNGCASFEDDSLVRRMACLVMIHDLMPHEEDVLGIDSSELLGRLQALGFKLERHTLRRYLEDAADMFWVYPDGRKGQAVLWKRVHGECLGSRIRPLAASGLAAEDEHGFRGWKRMGATRPGDCPDFPSQIVLNSM